MSDRDDVHDSPGGDGGATRDDHAREEIVEELQLHTPEGRDARPSARRKTMRVMVPLAVVGLIVWGVVTWVYGGWGAAVVGVILLLMFYFIGWSPVWIAGVLRAKESQEVEREAEAQVADDRESRDDHERP